MQGTFVTEGSRFSGEWIGIAVRGFCRGDEELGEYRLGTGVVVVHYHQGIITEGFRGENFSQLYYVGVLQLFPHVDDLHAFGRLKTETM